MAYNIDKPDAIFAAKRDFSNVNSGVGRNALGLGTGNGVAFKSLVLGGTPFEENGVLTLYDSPSNAFVDFSFSDYSFQINMPSSYNSALYFDLPLIGQGGSGYAGLNFSQVVNKSFTFPNKNGIVLLEDGNGSQLTGITSSQIGAQPASANLSGFDNSTGVGFPVRTALNTWTNRGLTAPAAGITISNPSGIAGNPTFALSNDLLRLENLSSTGIAVRTATDTWAQRGLVGPAAGITISNSNGVAGNPTFSLSNDLLGLEDLSSTGFPVRTASDTWAQRQIDVVGPLIVTNPAGIAGNPVISVSGATTGASGVVPGLGGTGANNAATVSQLDAAFSVSGNTAVHSGVDLIVTPPQFSHYHHVTMTITGSSGASGLGNRNIILNPTGLSSGSSIEFLFNIAPLTGINVFVSGNGVLLDSFVTDGSRDRAMSKFVLGSTWQYFYGLYPV